MSDPVVSIILPVSEPAGRLAQAITSVLGQTFRSIELIVAVSPELLEGPVGEEISRWRESLRLCVPEQESSPAALLRTGAEMARGCFLSWLFPGDVYEPDRIERQLAAMAEAPYAGVVTSEVAIGRKRNAPGGRFRLRRDSEATLKSFLNGELDPVTMLVARYCLDEVGLFDAEYAWMHELDLAVRLCARFPFVHVPGALTRRSYSAHRFQYDPVREQEILRIRASVSGNETGGDGPTRSLETLGRMAHALGRYGQLILPTLRRGVADLVGKTELAVATLQIPDMPKVDGAKLIQSLGVPGAETLAIHAGGRDPIQWLFEAAVRSRANRIVLIHPDAVPAPDVFLRQLLHAAADGLVGCLPGPDPTAVQPCTEDSLIPGTLFQRSALIKMPAGIGHGEPQFWSALTALGRIGATAPAGESSRVWRRSLSGMPDALRNSDDLVLKLIDADWYAFAYPDVRAVGMDPVEHFMNFGWREGRNPNPWFHTAWYADTNRDELYGDTNPLEHFVQEGAARGLRPCASFDTAWYARHYLKSQTPCAEALHHFITVGLEMGVLPFPRLDQAGTDEVGTRAEPAPGDLGRGSTISSPDRMELVRELVDAEWYHSSYVEPGITRFTAAAHYLEHGWRKGYDPNPWFDTEWYLSQNPDAKSHDMDPLSHFVHSGADQGRPPHPYFDIDWYARHYLGGAEPTPEALRHFLTIGLQSGGVPHPRIATPAIRKRLLELPVAERGSMIKRLRNLIAQGLTAGSILDSRDADLWPLLLAGNFPADASAVLLIHETGSPEAIAEARAGASVLPMQEFPIFGVLEQDHLLRIGTAPEHSSLSVSVSVRIPEQIAMLGDLLAGLGCQRAAPVAARLLDTRIARAIRHANIPVFLNGLERGK